MKIITLIVVALAAVSFSALVAVPGAEEADADPDPEGWEQCGANLWYKKEGTVVTFKGSGDMYHYGDDGALPQEKGPGGPWGKDITEVIWTSGNCNITRIGHSAFADCNNLTSMHWSNAAKVEGMGTVPGSVTSVGKYGFYHCGFTEMVFEYSNKKVSLDKYALSGMANVVKLTFNKASSFQTIYPVADWCGNLTTLVFNGNAKYGWMTFNGSSKIDTLEIGQNVSSIEGLRTDQNGDLQFKRFIVHPQNTTYSLDDGVLLKRSGADLYVLVAPIDKEYYYMSDDVTKIAHAAFAHSNIKELHISNKLTTIEYGAFRWSANLKTVLLPDSCTYVGNGAFLGCTALKKIHFGTGLSTMWAETFRYAEITKFSNDGNNVKIDYDSSWVDHQLTNEEIGYLKNMTFTKDGKTMEDTSDRYAVIGYFTNDDNNRLYSLSVVKKNGKISEPAEPVWGNHAFDGWYRDNDSWARQWVFSDNIVQGDVKLFGMWTADSEVQDSKYPARSWNGVQRALTLDDVNTIELQRDVYAYGKGHFTVGKDMTVDLNGFTLDRQRTTSDQNGYVFYVSAGKQLTIQDSKGSGKITGGYGSEGGAFYVSRSGANIGRLVIESGTITGNRSVTGGGAIYSRGGDVTINGGTITGNEAKYGGALYNTLAISGEWATATINGGTISNNCVTDDGGAVYIGCGTVTINGGTISGNSALTRCGGAVYLNSNDSTLNLYGGTLTGNIAAADGGAILYGGGTVNVKGSPVVEGNVASNGMDVQLRSNKFLTVTGAMSNGAMISLAAADASQILAKPNGAAIDRSYFKYQGGAVLIIEDGNLKVNLTDKPADYTWVSNYKQLQGAIDNNAQKIGLSADILGGFDDRIKVKSGKTVMLDLYGHVLDRKKGSVHSDGHVIQVMSGGNLTIRDSIGGGKITGGWAKNGGGINISDGGVCTLESGTITGNKADIDGGGLCVRGTFIATGGFIVNNYADDTGGAIYVDTSGTIQLSNITIASNKCDNYGGAMNVHVKDNNSWIRDSYIIGNIADDEEGGGIYFNQSGKTLTVERTVIAGNSSYTNGGGIYNNNGTLVLNNCSIYKNTAKGDGGGIYNNDTPVRITGGSISNNTCNQSGGAIRAYNGTTTITNVTFTGNVAKEHGGAIYLNNGGTVDINGCVMEGNTAGKNAGGIIVNDSSGNKLNIKGTVVIYGNKGSYGNDLVLASGKKITITGALGEGTKIGVTMGSTTGTFTSGYGTYHQGKDPTAFFVANDGYATYLNNGEAAIAKMSSSAYFDISVARTDGRTSQLTVRVKLIKNGQESLHNDVVITNAPVSTSFEIASAGSAVYTVVAEAIVGTDKDVYRCLVTGGDGNYTVTCKDVVAETEGFIDAIAEVEYTNACKARIDAARAAYEDLTDAQKQLVNDSGKTAVLTAAEATYANLKIDHDAADATIGQIDAIGEVEYTDACKARIDAARASYDALTAAQKQLVDDSGKTAVLTTAEDGYPALGVVSLIDAIGPYNPQEKEEYKTRVTAARSAYNLLTAAQKALVTNYDDLIEAEKNVEEGTAVDLTQVVVSFDGWEYGQYGAHSPTVNIDNVPEGEMKNHLASIIEQSKLEYTYLDSSGKGVVPSNSLPAGDYTAKITFPNGDGFRSGSKTTAFTVTQAQLTDITVNWTETAEWTGSVKTVDATAGPLSVGYGMDVEIRDNGGDITDPLMPGVYTIKLTITNGNYVFNIGGVSSEYSTTLTITKAANSITSLSLEGWTYGDEANTPTATATYGSPTYTYSPSLGGEYVQSVPTSSGSYYVKATVAATDVYNGAEATSQFSISKANLTIEADSTAVWKGDPAPDYTFKITGMIGEDTWADYYNGSPTVTCDYNPASSTEYQYPITVSLANVSLKDQSKDDYVLIPVDGVLIVQDNQGCTVTFDLNYNDPPEEDIPEPITVHKNEHYGTLPSATRAGYSFVGWFTAASGGTQVTRSTVVTAEQDHTLYAHWTVGTYTVSFDANKPQNASSSVTGNTADQQFTYDADAIALTANGYELTGWTFNGWNTAVDGSGTAYTNQQAVRNLTGTVGGVVELYAQWTAVSPTVTFDNNGGTGGQASKSVSYDSAYGDLPAPTKAGYSLAGWFTAAFGGTQITSSTIVSTTENHTLHAHWTSTVTLDLNGGDTGVSSITATYGVSTFDEIAIPVKANYVFAGYYTAADGGYQVIAPAATMSGFVHSAVSGYTDADGKWIATEAKTLYAHWICTVTLVYGEGEMDWVNITATHNSSSFAAREIPTKQGTEFLGYFTNDGLKIIDKPAEGTTISGFVTGAPVDGYIDAEGKWVADGSKTLYVHWDNYYTVVFDYNGGQGAISMKTVNGNPATYGELPNATRLGYDFVGWYTEPVAGIKVESTTAVTTDHTVYAHWKGLPCTVTFNYGNMPNPPSTPPRVVDYGSPIGDLPESDNPAYTITWYTQEGIVVTKDTVVTADCTIYALWQSTVTLDSTGGTGGPDSIVATYGDNAFIVTNIPSRDGYTFEGYYTAATGGDLIIAAPDDGDNISGFVQAAVAGYLDVNGCWIATEVKTLYAHWSAISYTVTFDANGGSVSPTSKVVSFDSVYGDLPSPTRAGYEFDGWYTEVSGGSKVVSSTIVTTASDHTLYAHWNKLVVVTFDANGGSVSPTSKTVSCSKAYGDLPVPTRAGYEFDGWYTEVSGGSKVVSSTIVSVESDHTLYAHWEVPVLVTFDANGGSVSPTSKTVYYGSAYGSLPVPYNSEYEFDGWYTAAYEGYQVVSSTIVSTESDHTLYAHWSEPVEPEETVTVYFDSMGGTPAGSKTVTVGSSYGSLPSTSRDGYDFEGWYTAASGGYEISSRTTVIIDSDHTLYAHWSEHEHIVNPDGSVTDRYTETVTNPDGSENTKVSETTVWPDGSSVVKESELYEKENPDGSSVMEYTETSIATETDGSVITTETSIVSDMASSGAVKTTEKVTTETDTEVTTQTKVTNVTTDGKVTISNSIRSEVEGYMIVTAALSETTSEGTTANVITVVQPDDGIIDADTAAVAVSNLAYVTAMLGAADVDAAMMIDATDLDSVTLTGDALEEFVEADLSLRTIFDDGTLHYDEDATKTLSRHDSVEISFSKDDESILTGAQKAAVGDASFVSVTAQAGQTYIKDLDGTVSITYIFGNPEGWKDFAAYHIAEDGTKTLKESSYDEGTGQVTIYSTHHSIYAVLEKSGGPVSDNTLIWIAAGIIAVLAVVAIVFYAIRSKKV